MWRSEHKVSITSIFSWFFFFFGSAENEKLVLDPRTWLFTLQAKEKKEYKSFLASNIGPKQGKQVDNPRQAWASSSCCASAEEENMFSKQKVNISFVHEPLYAVWFLSLLCYHAKQKKCMYTCLAHAGESLFHKKKSSPKTPSKQT